MGSTWWPAESLPVAPHSCLLGSWQLVMRQSCTAQAVQQTGSQDWLINSQVTAVAALAVAGLGAYCRAQVHPTQCTSFMLLVMQGSKMLQRQGVLLEVKRWLCFAWAACTTMLLALLTLMLRVSATSICIVHNAVEPDELALSSPARISYTISLTLRLLDRRATANLRQHTWTASEALLQQQHVQPGLTGGSSLSQPGGALRPGSNSICYRCIFAWHLLGTDCTLTCEARACCTSCCV